MPDVKPVPDPLKQDLLVEKLIPDPTQPAADVTALVGFVGKSTKELFWRLYLTPGLSEYVEIAAADIVSSESLTTPEKPLAGTLLWVKRSAQLQHTRSESRQIQAEFLQGGIVSEFLPGTGISVAGPVIGGHAQVGYSGGGMFCTWGQPCTARIITCTDKVEVGPQHRTEVVVCTPRE
jgi:hypothetical protein